MTVTRVTPQWAGHPRACSGRARACRSLAEPGAPRDPGRQGPGRQTPPQAPHWPRISSSWPGAGGRSCQSGGPPASTWCVPASDPNADPTAGLPGLNSLVGVRSPNSSLRPCVEQRGLCPSTPGSGPGPGGAECVVSAGPSPRRLQGTRVGLARMEVPLTSP